MLAVKDNRPRRAESMRDFFALFSLPPTHKTPHGFFETIGKNRGRIEHRPCFAYDQLDCLHRPAQWPDLNSFVVIEFKRTVKGNTTVEQRYYRSTLPPDAERASGAMRQYWPVEKPLHWFMDIVFADDQMRARTGYAAHNLALLRHITMNLIRLDPVPRTGGVKVRRRVAATPDDYGAHLFGQGQIMRLPLLCRSLHGTPTSRDILRSCPFIWGGRERATHGACRPSGPNQPNQDVRDLRPHCNVEPAWRSAADTACTRVKPKNAERALPWRTPNPF